MFANCRDNKIDFINTIFFPYLLSKNTYVKITHTYLNILTLMTFIFIIDFLKESFI